MDPVRPLRVFFLFALLAGMTRAADESLPKRVDLVDTTNLVLAHNLNLIGRRLQAEIPALDVEKELRAFRWQLRPNLTVEKDEGLGQAVRAGAEVEKRFRRGTRVFVDGDYTVRDGQENDTLLNLRLEQPLFQRYGKAFNEDALDAARFRTRTAGYGIELELNALILQSVEGFADVKRLQRRVKDEELAVVRSHELLRLVEARERQGRATPVDVLELKMVRQSAVARLNRLRRDEENARTDLAALMGRSLEQLPLLGQAVEPAFKVPQTAEAVGTGLSNRVERVAALDAYGEARRQLDVNKQLRYPDVRVVGRWQPEAGNQTESWYLGLSARRELDRKEVELGLEQDEKQVRAALTRVAQVELQIVREVRESLSSLGAAEAERELSDQQLILADTRLELARRLYAAQRADVTRLRDAENALVLAQARKIEADSDLLIQKYRLLRAMGLLIGE